MGKKLNFTRYFHLKTSTTPQKRLIGGNSTLLSNGDFTQLFYRLNSKLNKGIIVLFLVFGFSISQAVAQRDQITTQAGEKIRCRILDETPNRFVYAYLSPAGKVLRNEIFKNLVSEFKYNFYLSDIVTKGNKIPDGLGGAREENTNASARVDTRKGESSKQSSKDVEKSSAETKADSKKSDKKIADKEQIKQSEVVQDKKESETASTKTTETSKNDEKIADKTAATPKKTPAKQTTKPAKKVAKVKEEKMVTPMNPQNDKNEFSNYLKWRVGARGGFGNMLAKIPTSDEFSLYQEKLLRGWTWGADASYFFGDNFGMGVMFNNFQSQNKADNIKYKNIILNEEATGSISNKRSTKFIGPALYFRKNIDFKTMVVFGLAPGAYLYTDKGTYDAASYKFKGIDFGAAATLGVDFLLGNDITGRDIILSLEAGYNYGKMRALDFGNGGGAVNLSTPINLSRVDFTVGFRFTRYPKYFKLTSY
jgi:hypothetical protein